MLQCRMFQYSNLTAWPKSGVFLFQYIAKSKKWLQEGAWLYINSSHTLGGLEAVNDVLVLVYSYHRFDFWPLYRNGTCDPPWRHLGLFIREGNKQHGLDSRWRQKSSPVYSLFEAHIIDYLTTYSTCEYSLAIHYLIFCDKFALFPCSLPLPWTIWYFKSNTITPFKSKIFETR